MNGELTKNIHNAQLVGLENPTRNPISLKPLKTIAEGCFTKQVGDLIGTPRIYITQTNPDLHQGSGWVDYIYGLKQLATRRCEEWF